MVKEMDIQDQEVQRVSSQINPKKPTIKHIKIKFKKLKLKFQKRKQNITRDIEVKNNLTMVRG